MCTCINDIWGYCRHDYNYKTVNQLLFLLTNCAVQGGNLLLNVGPTGEGEIPAPQIERLEAVGNWMARHRDSVCGTERLPSPYFAYGRITRKGRCLYLHTYYWPGTRMIVANQSAEVWGGQPGTMPVRARILTTGDDASCHWDGERLIIEGLPANPPDPADTVIVLEVDSHP